MSEEPDAACRAALHAVAGEGAIGRPPVLHAAAVFESAPGAFAVLRVNAAKPPSPSDAFALALARARADVILTSGRNLRDEAGAPDTRWAEAEAWLADWRREALGRGEPARVAVLTRSGDVDPGHPVLRTHAGALLLTSRGGAAAFAGRAGHAEIEIITRDGFEPRDWIAHLLAQDGVETVLVEAGPATAAPLYHAPVAVDELMLSVCPASAVEDAARGPLLLHAETLAAAGLRSIHAQTRDEPSGRWSFQRYVRAPATRA